MPARSIGQTTGSISWKAACRTAERCTGGPGLPGGGWGCRVKGRGARGGLGFEFGRRSSATCDDAEEWAGRGVPVAEPLNSVASAAVFGCALCGFAAVAVDVSWASGLHALSGIDQGVHQWVVGHIPPEARDPFFEKVVSYSPLVPIFGTWTALGDGDTMAGGSIPVCSEEPGQQRLGDQEGAGWQDGESTGQAGVGGKRDGALLERGGIAGGTEVVPEADLSMEHWRPPDSLFYQFGAGTTIVMLLLKSAFHRARPGTDLHTLSFPSGHTTLAVLLTGMLIAIWLPYWERENGKGGDEVKHSIANFLQANMLPIWIGMWLVTAAGRICADAHWFSDCVAGGLLGLASTSLLAMLCTRPKNR